MRNGELIKSMAGTPQGGVISPLLSNIYLHAFDRIVSDPNGKFATANIRIVRYADDFVLMGNYYYSREILKYLDSLMIRMGLTINKEKTSILHISKKSLYFLGFEFRVIRSKFKWNSKNYTNVRPSMKSRSKLFSQIRELLSKRRHWKIAPLIYKLNSLLIGWLNYFSISKVTHIWETVKVIIKHLDYKLFKWLKSKGRKAHKQLRQRPYSIFVSDKGLLDLEKYARLKTLAKAQWRTLSVSRMRENFTYGLMKGVLILFLICIFVWINYKIRIGCQALLNSGHFLWVALWKNKKYWFFIPWKSLNTRIQNLPKNPPELPVIGSDLPFINPRLPLMNWLRIFGLFNLPL